MKSRGNRMVYTARDIAKAVGDARAFNAAHPVGTAVRYWRGARAGAGVESKTRSEASVFGGHSAVVWIEGCSGCIALSHVEVLP